MSNCPLSQTQLAGSAAAAAPTAGTEHAGVASRYMLVDNEAEEERGDDKHDGEMQEEKAAAAVTAPAAAAAAAAAAAPSRKRNCISDDAEDPQLQDEDPKQLALEWTNRMSRQEGIPEQHMQQFGWWAEKMTLVESTLAEVVGMVPARAIGSAPLEQGSASAFE